MVFVLGAARGAVYAATLAVALAVLAPWLFLRLCHMYERLVPVGELAQDVGFHYDRGRHPYAVVDLALVARAATPGVVYDAELEAEVGCVLLARDLLAVEMRAWVVAAAHTHGMVAGVADTTPFLWPLVANASVPGPLASRGVVVPCGLRGRHVGPVPYALRDWVPERLTRAGPARLLLLEGWTPEPRHLAVEFNREVAVGTARVVCRPRREGLRHYLQRYRTLCIATATAVLWSVLASVVVALAAVGHQLAAAYI